MGVKRLTTFIQESYQWEKVLIRDQKLVIDGFALCFDLYFAHHSSTWYLGGDYSQFYSTTYDYFSKLRRLHIDTYIVMDGIDYKQAKVQTVRQRIVSTMKTIAKFETRKASVLPLFAIQVFIDVVRDMKLHFLIADGEGDAEVASLANHLGCPVLSNDSDFFIFNIEGGYIPLDEGNRSNLRNGYRVKIFRYQRFDKQYTLVTSDIRLFFPVILGNDFHQSALTIEMLDFDPRTPAEEVVYFLTGYRSTDKVIQDLRSVSSDWSFSGIIKRIENVRQQYQILVTSFHELKTSRRLQEINPSIPRWVLSAYKRGDFHMCLITFLMLDQPRKWQYWNVIEDMQQVSAWEFTKSAREYILGILSGLGSPDVKIVEVVRRPPSPITGIQHGLLDQEINLDLKQLCIADLPQVPNTPHWERKRMLLHVFGCSSIQRLIECRVPSSLHLAVIASHFWLMNNPSYYDYLRPLVCCILNCHGKLRCGRLRVGRTFTTSQLRIIAHVFAHWQCSLHHVIALNQVLSQPYQYTSPAHLFSGYALHHYLQHPDTPWESRSELVQELICVIRRGVAV